MSRSRCLVSAVALLVAATATPLAATTFTVTNLNDSGVNSLRWAITSANADNSPPHTINFSVSGTIALAAASGPLPAVARTTAIDAASQKSGTAPGVRVDGSALAGTPNGISFGGNADLSSVNYLAITGFGGYGVAINSGSDGDQVTHCYIGLATDGTTAAGNAAGGIVVYAANAAIGHSLLDGNVISANGGPGILLNGAATGAGIRGNYIGTSAAGTAARANATYGIQGNGATNVTVGGPTVIIPTANLIAGNTNYGIALNAAASGWTIAGNNIGVDATGAAALGNGGGIDVASDNNVIGSTAASGANVIAGNLGNGIVIEAAADQNAIYGNRIGTNGTGTASMGAQFIGIQVYGTNCTIGGSAADHRNLISGNSFGGIAFESGSTSSVAIGNYIGTDSSGTSALPNGGGVALAGNANRVGGPGAGERNVIAGNIHYGVTIYGTDNVIQGNYIGTDVSGAAALANGSGGIRALGASNAVIGGINAADGNVVSGNGGNGIVFDSDTTGASIRFNLIGVNAANTAALPNVGGVGLAGSNHTLGGIGVGNVIAGNTSTGVSVYGTGHTLKGNYIGTNALDNAAVGNSGGGIRVLAASNITIGGALAGERNVISHNNGNGIGLDNTSSGCTILGNRIGTNVAGTAAFGNVGSGIAVDGSGHTIGVVGAANVIAASTFPGIAVSGTGHAIKGNYIGTNALSSGGMGNGSAGIRVLVASGVVIGGFLPGEGNVISGNGNGGIAFDGTSAACTVLGNFIGTNVAGTAALANVGSGIVVGGTGHTIGGNVPGARNLISGNTTGGIYLTGSGHQIAGNWIGVNAAGTAAIANGGSYGIRADGVHDTTIGGPTAAAGNVISGNARGVNLGYASHHNSLYNNVIGLNAAATADLPDNGSGLELAGGSHHNQIGAAGMGNVIAGSTYQGIIIYDADTTANKIQGNFIGTNKALAPGLGNVQLGIFVTDAIGNTIGGAGQGNVVANNGYIGIWVERGERNEIAANSIYANGYLGIDVGEQGVHQNDGGDGDDGGNRSQNYPLLDSVTLGGGGTVVHGLLLNEPSTSYRVEVFSSPTCDSTGFGEGKTFLGSTMVMTGPSGQGALAATLPLVAVDPFVSATVTDALGNTSEFSPCAAVGGPNAGKLQFLRQTVLGYEGTVPTADVVITRSQGLSGTVTAQFTIDDDTALAGFDYTDVDQVVTFAPWEVVKTIQVPILYDPAVEVPDPESAKMHLSNPTNGATLGLADSTLVIWDNNPAYPGVWIDDAAIAEGNAGQKMLSFAVHISPSDHQVTIGFLTEDLTAVQGEDYEYTEGEVDFPVGSSLQIVQVPIYGDDVIEGDEAFTLRLTTAPAGGVWVAFDALAKGTILEDDDPAGGNPLFLDSFEFGSTVLWSESAPH